MYHFSNINNTPVAVYKLQTKNLLVTENIEIACVFVPPLLSTG